MEGNKPRLSCCCLLILFVAILGPAGSADDSSGGAGAGLSAKCEPEFQKVMQCLPFVSNKANVPTKECCDSATELKNDDPVCLCYIIQQIHNGSNAAVKSMGLQESRLLQLPAACKMTNASVSECPKLLNLPPNSPDAAIFTNTTAPTTNSSSPTTSSPSSSRSSNSSDGLSYQKPPRFFAMCLIVIAICCFLPLLTSASA